MKILTRTHDAWFDRGMRKEYDFIQGIRMKQSKHYTMSQLMSDPFLSRLAARVKSDGGKWEDMTKSQMINYLKEVGSLEQFYRDFPQYRTSKKS